jgi:hypothetical protein
VARIPTLLAERTADDELRVWCRYCGKFHYHGAADGHRVAHCIADDSPYHLTGYYLLEVDSLTLPPYRYPVKYLRDGRIVSGLLRKREHRAYLYRSPRYAPATGRSLPGTGRDGSDPA